MRKQTKSLNHTPQEAAEAESIHWRRALRHNTVVLWQQEPISQILGRLKAARHTLYTLASRGGNGPRFVATLEQLQLITVSSPNSSHLRVTSSQEWPGSVTVSHSPPLLECNPSIWEQPKPWVSPQLLLVPHGSKNSHTQQHHTSNKQGLSPHWQKFTGN